MDDAGWHELDVGLGPRSFIRAYPPGQQPLERSSDSVTDPLTGSVHALTYRGGNFEHWSLEPTAGARWVMLGPVAPLSGLWGTISMVAMPWRDSALVQFAQFSGGEVLVIELPFDGSPARVVRAPSKSPDAAWGGTAIAMPDGGVLFVGATTDQRAYRWNGVSLAQSGSTSPFGAGAGAARDAADQLWLSAGLMFDVDGGADGGVVGALSRVGRVGATPLTYPFDAGAYLSTLTFDRVRAARCWRRRA